MKSHFLVNKIYVSQNKDDQNVGQSLTLIISHTTPLRKLVSVCSTYVPYILYILLCATIPVQKSKLAWFSRSHNFKASRHITQSWRRIQDEPRKYWFNLLTSYLLLLMMYCLHCVYYYAMSDVSIVFASKQYNNDYWFNK